MNLEVISLSDISGWLAGPKATGLRGLVVGLILPLTWVLIRFNSLITCGVFWRVHVEHLLLRDWLKLWGKLLDSYTEAHTSRPPWALIFTFGVKTKGLRIEVFRHDKPFRELKIRFIYGLQLPSTGWRFLFIMLWVLVARDRECVITSCNQDSGCSPLKALSVPVCSRPPPSVLILSSPPVVVSEPAQRRGSINLIHSVVKWWSFAWNVDSSRTIHLFNKQKAISIFNLI